MPELSFREWVDERGGVETARTQLSVVLGREVRKEEVSRYYRGSRAAPKRWLDALGLTQQADKPLSDPFPDGGKEEESEGRRTETPPRKPEEAKTAPTPAALQTIAKERIVGLHNMVGAGIAVARDPHGFETDTGPGGGVAKIWSDKSPEIADCWIAWANEGNKMAQAFVRMMATGGAGGELVLGYASLVFGTAYVIGTAPDNEVTRAFYGRYTRYRPQPSPQPGSGTRDDGAAAAASPDAAAAAGSVHPLGQAARTARG